MSLDNRVTIHINSLPRSGTHFFMDSIMKQFNDYNSCTIYKDNNIPHQVKYGPIYYQLPLRDKYILKSHFIKEEFNVPNIFHTDCLTVYPISYFYDSIYSDCKLIRRTECCLTDVAPYIVTEDLFEWEIIFIDYINKLTEWMDSIDQSLIIRYEDISAAKTESIKLLCNHLGVPPEELFSDFKVQVDRSYYNKTITLESMFDTNILNILRPIIDPLVEKYYPETL